ncbi:Deleted in autism protein 1 [Nymphon striatum]|nr:Deleted in autism protein 1 [Nymphon striatum]
MITMRLFSLVKRLSSLIVVVFILFYVISEYFPIVLNRVENTEFIELDSCPFCFGHSVCKLILMTNYADLTGISKLKWLNFINGKNVYFARLESGTDVVLKKLSWNSEIYDLGKQLCEMIDLDPCDFRNAVRLYVPKFMKYFHQQSERSRAVFGIKDVLACPSERFLSLMLNNFMDDELAHVNYDRLDALSEFVTMLHLNPEPLIIQSFPAQNGWPFPHYYGACGRIIVEENGGKPLSDYLYASWNTRVQLSYQLMKIAEKLTNNQLNLSLYMTDVNLNNFAVSPEGHLTLIDAENIIVVDKQKNWKDQPATWNITLTNQDLGCIDCLSYSVEDLCSYQVSDHNYYAICRGILGRNSYYAGSEGFLHNIPESVEQTTKLSLLLEECSNPTVNDSRIYVSHQLLSTLHNLSIS